MVAVALSCIASRGFATDLPSDVSLDRSGPTQIAADASAGRPLADEQSGRLLGKYGPAHPPPTSADLTRSAELSALSSVAATADPTRSLGSRLARARLASTRMPVGSGRISSGYGMRVHPILGGVRMHWGVDLAAPSGAPIMATTNGTVRSAGWSGGYGLLVALDDPSGIETRYGHMSRVAVAAGQEVRAGQILGFVGSTGRSTGPHVHYEVRVAGRAVDPARPRPGA
ncbi:MAG: M23 family metallopeptidase [Novosphingobium sp.]|nr:M23 family metallopeptidase [Novosphingobium sp.]